MPWPRSWMRRPKNGECLLCEEATISAAPTCGLVMINRMLLLVEPENLLLASSPRFSGSGWAGKRIRLFSGLRSGPLRSSLDLHQLADPRRRSLGRLTDYEFSGATRLSC